MGKEEGVWRPTAKQNATAQQASAAQALCRCPAHTAASCPLSLAPTPASPHPHSCRQPPCRLTQAPASCPISPCTLLRPNTSRPSLLPTPPVSVPHQPAGLLPASPSIASQSHSRLAWPHRCLRGCCAWQWQRLRVRAEAAARAGWGAEPSAGCGVPPGEPGPLPGSQQQPSMHVPQAGSQAYAGRQAGSLAK